MKKIIVFLVLICILNACKEEIPLKPPFIITSLSEGDGCCDISFRDVNGNHGWRCTSFGYLRMYHAQDTLKIAVDGTCTFSKKKFKIKNK